MNAVLAPGLLNDGGAKSITDVSATIPAWSEIYSVLTFQAGFNSAVVIAGATFLGLAAGVVGTFAMLRNRALMGDALAHSALPGICLAFLAAVALGYNGKSMPLLLSGAAISGVAGVLTVHFLTHYTRLAEETAIGAVLSVFFGVGVVLLSLIQNLHTGSEGGLHHFIYGQTAAMQRSDAILTAVLALVAVFLSVLLLKEFRIVCFDDNFAAVQGWPVGLIDLIMMALVVVVTVTGLQAVGLILIVAMLVVPASAARFWTDRLNSMCVMSGLFGALSGYFGAAASTLLPRLPAGAVIVLTSGVFFLISFFFAPQRGLVGGAIRLLRLRSRVAREHLLRGLYEIYEAGSAGGLLSPSALPVESLRLLRGWSPLQRWIALASSRSAGFLIVRDGSLTLTPEGLEEAKQYTRNHRLWEQYLFTYGELPASHVDYSADLAEHVLSPSIIEALEQALLERGRIAAELANPGSVHPLPAGPNGGERR